MSTATGRPSLETIKLSGTYDLSNFELSDDGHNGTTISYVTGDDVTIGHNGVTEFSAAVALGQTTTFSDATGHLILDDPSSFDGTIFGFTGDGTLAGSDQIDLKGIDYTSTSFTESFDAATDILTVSDGSHSATLHFSGTYQEANFKFQSDGDHGTTVYDPPVPSTPASPPVPANLPAGSPATGGSSNFSFNFADTGHGVSNDSHPAMDQSIAMPVGGPVPNAPAGFHPIMAQSIEFVGGPLPSVQSSSSAGSNGGQGETLFPLDGPDGFNPTGVIKALLHASDFHVA